MACKFGWKAAVSAALSLAILGMIIEDSRERLVSTSGITVMSPSSAVSHVHVTAAASTSLSPPASVQRTCPNGTTGPVFTSLRVRMYR